MNDIHEHGYLLEASTTGCVVGYRVAQVNIPAFGGMVRIPLDPHLMVYGLIFNIQIVGDDLVRQLVTAGNVSQEVIQDNRANRNVPLEISVLFTGYEQDGQVFHLLPPRPPLTLDAIYACTPAELKRFTSAGRFGYFRHVLRASDLPVGELLAAHLKQAAEAHSADKSQAWIDHATQELITLLRDDYQTLMNVLNALSDTHLFAR